MAFANLLHLWSRGDVSIPVKDRVYNTTVRSVVLYGCETWPLRQQDVHHLEVFDHRCLRQLANVGWSDRVSNLGVWKCVFGGKWKWNASQENKIMQTLMAGSCVAYGSSALSKSSPVLVLQTEWRRPGGQQMTWQCEMMSSVIAAFTWLRPKRFLK